MTVGWRYSKLGNEMTKNQTSSGSSFLATSLQPHRQQERKPGSVFFFANDEADINGVLPPLSESEAIAEAVPDEQNRILQSFWSKVEKTETCWLWLGSLNSGGYGQYWLPDGTRIVAHRYAYGDVQQGMELDHLCRVRRCVRPSHLEEVSHLENMRRGSWAMRTHCPRGHAYDHINTEMYRGRRYCRACQRINNRASYARKRSKR